MTTGWLLCDAREMFGDEMLIRINTINGWVHCFVSNSITRYREGRNELQVGVLAHPFNQPEHYRVKLPNLPVEGSDFRVVVVPAQNIIEN